MVIAEALIEVAGAVAEFAIDLLPDRGKPSNDAPKPVPHSEYEQRPPAGPLEER